MQYDVVCEFLKWYCGRYSIFCESVTLPTALGRATSNVRRISKKLLLFVYLNKYLFYQQNWDCSSLFLSALGNWVLNFRMQLWKNCCPCVVGESYLRKMVASWTLPFGKTVTFKEENKTNTKTKNVILKSESVARLNKTRILNAVQMRGNFVHKKQNTRQ